MKEKLTRREFLKLLGLGAAAAGLAACTSEAQPPFQFIYPNPDEVPSNEVFQLGEGNVLLIGGLTEAQLTKDWLSTHGWIRTTSSPEIYTLSLPDSDEYEARQLKVLNIPSQPNNILISITAFRVDQRNKRNLRPDVTESEFKIKSGDVATLVYSTPSEDPLAVGGKETVWKEFLMLNGNIYIKTTGKYQRLTPTPNDPYSHIWWK